ncbi:T9SS type B sorting domain-containing protein [Mucilaginibacter ginsenosidivorax]|uniref:T9SS type B sorting domain-containing protein n=1 Tax=Mucilaginibacter ginsenosidivorax TaxID=862126 RepID=A0A5B8W5L8_9SPHI|nr:gliding motility-associated C-terminal domain-containing protein [Mucilaginibacter ginsenosidivorax]QEC78202.1 T9SS type B sorting domain-containing protein [Mucilaginibacter ginsenosidivorax]
MNKRYTCFLWLLIHIIFSVGAFAQSPAKVNAVFQIYKDSVQAVPSFALGKVAAIGNRQLKVNATPTVLAPNIKYQSPQVYITNTIIPSLTPVNTGGVVPAAIYGQVSTFAGGRAPVTYDSQGTDAGFNLPSGISTDATGNIYVSDFGSGGIRKISSAANVHTIANTNSPSGLALDSKGNIYVTDFNTNKILKITPAGVSSVFAGSGNAGKSDGTGNAASFNAPGGITIDASDNIYVADQQNNSIRMISPAGVVKTLAGSGVAGANNANGLAATFNNPDGLAIDKQGNIYVADTKNNMIRKIATDGSVTTVAGSGAMGNADGLKTAASFNYPTGLAIDAPGNLYVADYKNHSIRKITPAGQVTTIAGNGSPGSVNSIGSAATFNYPIGLAFDFNGNLFITDFGNYLVREINLTGYAIDKQLPPGLVFDPKTGIISGTPTAASPATDYTVTGYNAGGSSSTTINIQVSDVPLKPSVITFTGLPQAAKNIIKPSASSTNPETPIIFTSSNPAVATITADGNVLLTGVGYTTITATQAGNANYSTAAPVSRQLVVYQQGYIAFAALPVKHLNDADFAPVAKSNVTAFPITYTSSNPQVATIVNGLIHITGIGTTTITASQAGDVLNIAATPVTRELTVSPMLAFGAISSKITCDNDFDPGATSLKPITYTSSNPTVATIVNGQVHMVAAGTSTITATSNGEVLTQVLTVNAVSQPAISISSDLHNPNCNGTVILFTANPTNAGTSPTYAWQVNGSAVGTNSTTFSSSTLANGDVVTCTLTNSSTCAGPLSAQSNTITLNVIKPLNPSPSVTITASANGVYAGTAVRFTATAQPAAVTTYQWQVNGTNMGLNQSTFTGNAFNNGDVVTCTITTSNACTAPVTSNLLVVNILPPVVITVVNAFSPNGDGVNDTWNIPNLSFFPDCLVSVFNRYGLKVMQSTGYTKAWDGTYGGKTLPAGVYYYIIDTKDSSRPRLSGNVTILR